MRTRSRRPTSLPAAFSNSTRSRLGLAGHSRNGSRLGDKIPGTFWGCPAGVRLRAFLATRAAKHAGFARNAVPQMPRPKNTPWSRLNRDRRQLLAGSKREALPARGRTSNENHDRIAICLVATPTGDGTRNLRGSLPPACRHRGTRASRCRSRPRSRRLDRRGHRLGVTSRRGVRPWMSSGASRRYCGGRAD